MSGLFTELPMSSLLYIGVVGCAIVCHSLDLYSNILVHLDFLTMAEKINPNSFQISRIADNFDFPFH